MTNYHFLIHFLKDYDVIYNVHFRRMLETYKKYIVKFSGDITSRSLLMFVNNSCGWGVSKEGRKYYERLHALIQINSVKYNVLKLEDVRKFAFDNSQFISMSNINEDWFKSYVKVLDINESEYYKIFRVK